MPVGVVGTGHWVRRPGPGGLGPPGSDPSDVWVEDPPLTVLPAGLSGSPKPGYANPAVSNGDPNGYVPIIFGRRRIKAPILVSHDYTAGGDPSFWQCIVLLGEGQIYTVGRVWCNGQEIANAGSPGFGWALYPGSPAGETCAFGFPTVAPPNTAYLNIQIHAGSAPLLGTYPHWGWLVPGGGAPSFEVEVYGRLLFDPRDGGQSFATPSTWLHTDNVALAIRDVLANPRWKLAYPAINDTSFSAGATICDSMVGSPSAKRFTCNDLILQPADAGQHLAQLLMACNGELYMSPSGVALFIDVENTGSPVMTLDTARNFLGTKFESLTARDSPTQIVATYSNIALDFADDTIRIPTTLGSGVELREASYNFGAMTDVTHVTRAAAYILNQNTVTPVRGSGQVSQAGIVLNRGDKVAVTTSDGPSAAPFLITDAELLPDGGYNASLRQYDASVYTDAAIDTSVPVATVPYVPGPVVVVVGGGGTTLTPPPPPSPYASPSPIVIPPAGTATGQGGEIQLRELAAGGTNVTGFGAPDSLAADIRYTLPDTAPTLTGQVFMWDSTAAGRVKTKWDSVNVEKLVIEVPTGTIDGANKVFILSKTPVSANVTLIIDKMPFLYAPTGTTVTIPSTENAPEISIWAIYSEGGSGFTSTGTTGGVGPAGPPGPLATGPVMAVEVPTGAINGVNDTYAIAHLPTTDLALIADDQKVNDGVDYNRTGTGIVFAALANKPARSLLALYGYASASGSVVGTVSSVSLSVPSDLLSVSGSPIIGAGTFAITLPSRAGNMVFAGPPTAGSSSPTFRSLVSDDIPVLDTSKITSGIFPYARGGTGASTAWTPGSIIFAGASAFAQNANFVYDYVNNRFGLGTPTPLAPLHLVGAARIDGSLTFVGARSISTTSDNLALSPAADLDLTPGGTARVRVTSGVRLQSDNYASQTTGWGISYAGAGDFRYLYADELHAKSFIADLEQALAGGQIISKSVAPLAAAFTVPAAGGTATLTVESFKGFDTFRVFVDGDMIRLRQFARTGTSLDITNCWGTVAWVSTDTTAKTQTYTFTRSSAPNAGAATTSSTIGAGTLALDYGTSGNGFLESNAIDGAMAENAPYHQIVSWTGHPNSGLTVRTRLGNLKGIFNVSNEYGLYAGSGITDASQYLRISDQAVEGHNLTIKLYDGAVNTVLLSPSAPSFAMGSTLPTAYGTGTGIWMGKDSSVYKFRVGIPAGQGIFWDGTNLSINGSVTITGISGLNYAAAATPGGAASTLAGQGALATKSSVDLSTGDVTNKSLANVDSTASTKLSGIATGATVGATWGTNLGSIPATLGTPSGAGLFLSSTYMGYYAASAWKTYIDSSGNMILGDIAGGNIGLSWNQGAATLAIKGAITITAGGNAATIGYADGVGSAAVSTASGDATTKANAAAAASLPLHSTADAASLAARVVASAAAAPSGAGLYLGSDYLGYYNGSAWRTYMDSSGNFYLGGSSGPLTWNAGTSTGTVAGWTINAAYLAKDTTVDATSAGMAPADYPFYAGATYANRATALFRVTPAGLVTAVSGTIGGWDLAASTLSSGGITLSASATAASNKIFVGTGTYANTNTAFYVGGDGKFSLKDKLVWTNAALTIKTGNVTLDSTGIAIPSGGVAGDSGYKFTSSGNCTGGIFGNGATDIYVGLTTTSGDLGVGYPILRFTHAGGGIASAYLQYGYLRCLDGFTCYGTAPGPGGSGATNDPGYGYFDSTNGYKYQNTKVVGAQGAAVADAANTTLNDAVTQLNLLLYRLRVHGLIAT